MGYLSLVSLILLRVSNHWISIYGTPHSLLSDNGGEFNNKEVRELGEKCNIKIKTTAAESPWSNGMNERNHASCDIPIKKLMDKMTQLTDTLVKAAYLTHNINIILKMIKTKLNLFL